jgi:predicted AlkP superfamily phosphohydrolase/phosphomutase
MSSSSGGEEAEPVPKVLVIGLDGAGFEILEPLMKEKRIPHIENLINKGCSGLFESTIPPVTIPAWVSMLTGKNPGKIGCFDLLKQVGYLSEPSNSCFHDNTPIWQILNKYCIKTGLMNIPGTYPPETVDGFIVTGMMTPSKHSEYSYPVTLSSELEKNITDYEIDVPQWHYFDEDRFLKDLYKVTENRKNAAEYLVDKLPCDFYMLVFTSSDRLQHVLWNKPNIIEDYWENLDKTIGTLIEKFENSTIFIVSDHGFGPLNQTFHVNEWLSEKGYLKRKKDIDRSMRARAKLGRFFETFYRSIGKRIPFIDSLLRKIQELVGHDTLQKAAYSYLSKDRLGNLVNWEKTKAFAGVHSPHFGQIYVNLEEKMEYGCVPIEEYENVRNSIIHDLREICDPKTGEKIKIKVFKSEELYNGDFLKNAPDIVFLMENGTVEIDAKLGFRKIFEKGNPFTGWTGTHTLNGVFIAKGPNIFHGEKLEKTNILDLTPTILKIYGIPVPEDMDGTPINDIFIDEFKQRKILVQEDKIEQPEEHDEKGLTEDEKSLIEERLRALGYIS